MSLDSEVYDLSSIDRAKSMANYYHAGQVDKAGKPYTEHLFRVANTVNSRYAVENRKRKTIAWLHDILEDTNVTPDEVLTSFGVDIFDAVVLLTRNKNQSYSQYIDRLIDSDNKNAIAVKIVDLHDNMDMTRLSEINETDIERLKKYYAAYLKLNIVTNLD